jgi:hypothetical protein
VKAEAKEVKAEAKEVKAEAKEVKAGAKEVKAEAKVDFKVDVVVLSSLTETKQKKDRDNRNNGELFWMLISLHKFASWVNKVYILTNGLPKLPFSNFPEALSAKITILDRCTLMLPSNCPTFNSYAAGSVAHKIQGLSEHFILADDDIILGRHTSIADFFIDGGKPAVFRKSASWSKYRNKGPHKMYAKLPTELRGKPIPRTVAPYPHYWTPMLVSTADRLEKEYPTWVKFLRSHKNGRWGSDGRTGGGQMDEALRGVWDWYKLETQTGVYKNIDNGSDKSNEFHVECCRSYTREELERAASSGAMMINVNDAFQESNLKLYREQLQNFHRAFQKLFPEFTSS